jgi:hypothetical protein
MRCRLIRLFPVSRVESWLAAACLFCRTFDAYSEFLENTHHGKTDLRINSVNKALDKKSNFSVTIHKVCFLLMKKLRTRKIT